VSGGAVRSPNPNGPTADQGDPAVVIAPVQGWKRLVAMLRARAGRLTGKGSSDTLGKSLRAEHDGTSERKRLFTTFSYLVAKQGATAVLGLAYWVMASRLFSARDVGLAASGSSVAFFLVAIGALGIPILLLAELDSIDPSERRIAITTGTVIASTVVLILSLGSLALAPYIGNSLLAIRDDPVTALLFVIGSVAIMAATTFDNAAIGLHRGSAQLTRGTLGSLIKLVCVAVLVAVGVRTSAGLLFAWSIGFAVSLVACVPMLRLEKASTRTSLRERLAISRRYGMLSFKHHVLNLSINSISYIVPLTAALLIGPQQVAYFTAAFLLSATVLIIPYLLTLSLFAERAGDEGLLHRHIRNTLPVGLAICGAIVVVVELTAPLVLRIFGPAYAVNGATALRLLILVGPSYVIKDHYVAIRRAQGRLSEASKIMAIGTTAEVIGSAIGAVLGSMNGLCIGWAIAATGEALLLMPAIMRVYRRPPTSATDETEPSDRAPGDLAAQGPPAGRP
jgi:O-antigen/teichoic acid export membrane protein